MLRRILELLSYELSEDTMVQVIVSVAASRGVTATPEQARQAYRRAVTAWKQDSVNARF